LALLADEHPELKRTLNAVIDALNRKTAEGMHVDEIDKELERVIDASRRKPTSNDFLLSLRALRNEDLCRTPILFAKLQTVLWTGQEDAFKFLRWIAAAPITELNARVLKMGF
jgi:hypothetical protein